MELISKFSLGLYHTHHLKFEFDHNKEEALLGLRLLKLNETVCIKM